MTSRRSFLVGSAAAAALARFPAKLWSQSIAGTPELVFSVDAKRKLATMPLDFTGLSYETAQLGHPEYFSASNKSLIALIRGLGKQGVLRIGGSTSDFTTWSENDADAAQNDSPAVIGPVGYSTGLKYKPTTVITPAAIRNLNRFSEAVGWPVLYGLNLKRGTVENAVAEANFVAATLGSRLVAFQLGNEPDHDYMPESVSSKPLPSVSLSFDQYYDRWLKFHDAIRQAVPSARFAGPDTAGHYDWLAKLVDKRADMDFFSAHFYAEGPPSNPEMNLDFLLRRGRLEGGSNIVLVQQAISSSGKPFRLTEGNSCYSGGKAGVSDTVASALWCADFMLQLAQAGYSGVNLHGGGTGYYTPIANSLEQGYSARPVYYGMMLAKRFVGSSLVATSLSAQNPAQNVTGFAALCEGGWKLALFNKAPEPVKIKIEGLGATPARGEVALLHGKQIDAREGVTFGGSTVAPDGAFSPKPESKILLQKGEASMELAAYSAAYIQI